MAVKGAIIAIDFDGTVVTHAYPHMGMDAGAVFVLKELVANDCKLILYTMRSGQLLEKSRPMVQGTENSAVRHQRESRAEVLDFVAESPRRPLYRRQCTGMSDPLYGRRSPSGSRLGENPPTTGRSRLPGLSPGISPVPESRIPPNRSRRTGGRETKLRFREADRWLVTTTSGLSGGIGHRKRKTNGIAWSFDQDLGRHPNL